MALQSATFSYEFQCTRRQEPIASPVSTRGFQAIRCACTRTLDPLPISPAPTAIRATNRNPTIRDDSVRMPVTAVPRRRPTVSSRTLPEIRGTYRSPQSLQHQSPDPSSSLDLSTSSVVVNRRLMMSGENSMLHVHSKNMRVFLAAVGISVK